MIPFVLVKSIDLGSVFVVAWGWEQEGLENDSSRVQGFFAGIQNVLELYNSSGSTTLQTY